MKTYFNILAAFIIGFWLSACGGEKHQHAEGEENNQSTSYTCPMHPQILQDKPGTCPICAMDLVPVNTGSAESGEIMLSESQIKLGNISTQKVGLEEIGNTTILTGNLKVNEEAIEVVSSRVGGRIETLFVKEVGQVIQKGQPLYEVYSEQLLTLQKEYVLALQQYNEMEQKDRYSSFLKASGKKLLLLGLTQSQIEQLGKDKNIEPKITFLSPVSGYVAEISSAEGQYVSEGGLLYKVENLEKIWVEAQLYPGEASLVKQGDKVRIVVNGYENEPVTGKVTFLSSEFTKGTQVIKLRAEIPNPEKKFFPGMQANIILTNSTKKSIALPTDAVIRDEEGSHVWVQPKEGVFESRMVKTGLENFEKVEILDGLSKNESVVVTGAYLLYSEYVLKKGGNPMAGHNHSENSAGKMELGNTAPHDEHSNSQPEELRETKKSVPEQFKNQLNQALEEYYKINEALFNSNAVDAAQASKETLNAIDKIDMRLLKGNDHEKWMNNLKVIDKELKIISTSKDVNKQRVALAGLSNTLHKTLKYFKIPDSDVYYQFCPMALNNSGAYWLSNNIEISNPFFGEQMAKCGETKEVLKGGRM